MVLFDGDNPVMCAFHSKRNAQHSFMMEGGGVVYVCNPCRHAIENQGVKRVICKFCGVLIESATNTTPVDGEHGENCPRRAEARGADCSTPTEEREGNANTV